MLTLPDEPRTRKFWICCDELVREMLRAPQTAGRCASDRRPTSRHWRAVSSPFSSATPAARPPSRYMRHGSVGTDLDAKRARGAGDRRRDTAGAVLREAPGAECAVDLAHVVMQQHVRRARRTRSQERADDAARRLRALQRVELEPFVQQVGRGCVTVWRCGRVLSRQALRDTGRASAGPAGRAGSCDEGSGGTSAEHGLIAFAARAITRPYSSEASASLWRVAIDFPARQVVIVPGGEIVAIVHRRDRARQRQDFQPVLRQFEVADDLRPQQADDVRELGEL